MKSTREYEVMAAVNAITDCGTRMDGYTSLLRHKRDELAKAVERIDAIILDIKIEELEGKLKAEYKAYRKLHDLVGYVWEHEDDI